MLGSLGQRFFSTKSAAVYLGLSPKTLEKYRVKGGGPQFYKLGRRCLYTKEALDAWAAKQRRSSTAEADRDSVPE